jgi:hypothetical protein
MTKLADFLNLNIGLDSFGLVISTLGVSSISLGLFSSIVFSSSTIFSSSFSFSFSFSVSYFSLESIIFSLFSCY